MSQPSSNFSQTCLSRNKSESQVKPKPSLKLPPIREISNNNLNLGTKGRIGDSFFNSISPKPSELFIVSSKKALTPRGIMSPRANRRWTALEPIRKPSTPASILIKKAASDTSQFMSLNSFDDIFKPLTEEKKDSRADPFVFAGPSKPKIVPVTPLGWRRNPGGRIPEKTSSMLGQLINEIENESLDQVQDS